MKPFLVKPLIKNPLIEDEFKKTLQGFESIQFVTKDSRQNVDLIVIELGKNSDLDKIQAYVEKTDDTEVFLLSDNSDPKFLIKTIRMGVNEFLTIPLDIDTVKDAMMRFLERQKKKQKKLHKKLGNIVSVVGSKGGVGTTTVAVNLAVAIALARKDMSVALLDMNILFGEVPMFLDISPKYHWDDITKNMERLDDFLLSNILSGHSSGVQILPSPRYLNNNPPPTPSMIDVLFDLMITKYDYIIVDLGQSLNDTAFKILNRSDLIQLITIQSLPCLSNAKRLIKAFIDFGSVNTNNVNIVMNRYLKKSMVTLETAEGGIGKKIGWFIPNDYKTTMVAINSGKSLHHVDPKSKIVESYDDYIKTLLPQEKKEPKKKKWFF